MVIDLRELKKSGKDSVSFIFLYEADGLCDIPGISLLNPVKINGVATLNRKSVFVEAEIEFTLEGSCTNCTAPAKAIVTAEINEEFAPVGTVGFIGYTYEHETVDLKKAVEDAIILNMPTKVLCKEDCAGLKY